jgi:short-subunit dehydrogenase
MFNNAGIAIQGEVRDMEKGDWDRIININLLGALHGTIAAYALMVEQGFGHIVNTASILGLVSIPTNCLYATTKHAIVGLSTSLRAEGAALGVNVSVVCPGFVQTGLYDAAVIRKADNDEFYAQVPFKRMDVTKAAREILKGVERNKAIIVFPLHARFMWWLQRINPNAMDRPNQEAIKAFRKIRRE